MTIGFAGSPPSHAWNPQPPVDAYFLEFLNHDGDEFMAALLMSAVVQGKHPHVVNENPTIRIWRRPAELHRSKPAGFT